MQQIDLDRPNGCLLSVHPAQIGVPSNSNDVGEEEAMLQGNEREVNELDSRP